jgi:hypothetical protein
MYYKGQHFIYAIESYEISTLVMQINTNLALLFIEEKAFHNIT